MLVGFLLARDLRQHAVPPGFGRNMSNMTKLSRLALAFPLFLFLKAFVYKMQLSRRYSQLPQQSNRTIVVTHLITDTRS